MGKHIKNAPLPEKEFDANEERWKYYRKTYPFEINTELLYLNTNKKRLVGRFTYSRNEKSLTVTQIPKENNSDSSIVLSGDVFFNFNENKIQAFKKNVKDIDDETRKLLDDVSNRYHSEENCVLMPVTGAMNNVKGKLYFPDNGSLKVSGNGPTPSGAYDRPDTLVYLIDRFYELKDKNISVFEAGCFFSCSIFRDSINSMNFPDYYRFMESFKDVYEFCSMMFKLDKDMVDRMIDSGSKPIKNKSDLLEYIELAEDYWKSRIRGKNEKVSPR